MVEQLHKYSASELMARRAYILRIMETGTPEELEALERAKSDPELHPQILTLIRLCQLMVDCQLPDDTP